MNEENKKVEAVETTENKNTENRPRKFDKRRPRNNNRNNNSRPKSDLEEKVIEIRRVTKVVKGGRQFRFAATVVVGNRKIVNTLCNTVIFLMLWMLLLVDNIDDDLLTFVNRSSYQQFLQHLSTAFQHGYWHLPEKN